MDKNRLLGGVLRRVDKAGLLKRFSFNTHTKIDGKKLVVPVINGIGYQLLGSYEHWAAKLYKKLLAMQDGVFIDVGANNGQTMLKIAAVRNPLNYIGFEPNPGCFYYMQKLAEKNKFTGYDIYPVGLHTENKIVTLISDNDFAAGASILINFRKNIDKFKIRQHVPVMRGDDVLAGSPPPAIAVIKADVEGAELEVIKGLTKTLNRYKPFVVLEILPVYDASSENGIFRKTRQDELLQVMAAHNYTAFRVNEATGGLTRLEEIEVHGDMSKTNYVFSPKEKDAAIQANFAVS